MGTRGNIKINSSNGLERTSLMKNSRSIREGAKLALQANGK